MDDGASVDLASHAFRLIVTGGGSGGHTYPALATVRALRSRLAAYGGKLEVTWVGTAGSLEERTAAGEGITFRAVATGKLRRARNPGFIGAELPDVLALADVMVSRSGAGTLAEITALGNAAVLIPLASSAGDEQRHNARYLTDLGAAVALLGAVTPDALRDALQPLLADPPHRTRIAASARALGKPDAAERLADTVLSVAGARTGTIPPNA